MTRKPKTLPVITGLEVLNAGAEGNAIARHNNKVVFIPYAAPGDVLTVQLIRQKKPYAEGRIVQVIKPSPFRVNPFCSHYGICGGCSWQHVAYNHQLAFKQQFVEDAFQRIGKFPYPAPEPILPSPFEIYYRNKLEFTFTRRKWQQRREDIVDAGENDPGLGFHLPGLFNRILDLDHCYLQASPSNEIRNALRNFAIENNYDFSDLKRQDGFLRNLIIRTSVTGEIMVILVVRQPDKEKVGRIFGFLQKKFPGITSLIAIVNDKQNDSITDLSPWIIEGKPYLTEQLDGLRFLVGPLSFFQTNPAQALQMYRLIHDYANLRGLETVYDLYSGTGTIALFLARSARQVIGIEYVAKATEDALRNAELNHVENAIFLSGDIAEVIGEPFAEKYGRPDLIVADPPRAGMHEKVIKSLIRLAAARIIYVSCNPATQARDIALLSEHYHVSKVQPLDMFPHTHHVENIVLLVRNS